MQIRHFESPPMKPADYQRTYDAFDKWYRQYFDAKSTNEAHRADLWCAWSAATLRLEDVKLETTVKDIER